MKLCSWLLMVFGRNFCDKRQTWVSEPHFGEVKGDAQPLLMAHWKAYGQLSICLNWTVFTVSYGSGAMRRNVYSSAVFTGGRPLCTQILPGQGRPPSTILGIRKIATLDYPMMKTACFCVPRFDRQMDGRICCSIYSTLRLAVKIIHIHCIHKLQCR